MRGLTMPSGKVKWFNAKKGYGFITDDKTQKDIFLHVSALENSKLRVLKEEQTIVYDIKEDKEQLRKTSPSYHIDKIKAPLFIVHGRKDYNVRIEQAETLMDALDEKDIPYEVMIKKEEGHGFVLEENRIELYQKMGEFFRENLAKN